MQTKLLIQILKKFVDNSEIGQNSRVQIVSRANWKHPKDIREVKLITNKLIGAKESHRLFIFVD